MFSIERFNQDLEYLVNIDSGSYCPTGIDTVNKWFEGKFQQLQWKTELIPAQTRGLGSSLLVTRGETEFDLLVLCHTDTVFPEGEVAKRPFSQDEQRYYGPGVADMKSGCLFVLYAIQELVSPASRIAIFFNGQHEIGCPDTRKTIEALSLKSQLIIATEPARANGDYVRQRKGISRYTFLFTGKSAHAGVNPEQGVCAVTELANWVIWLKQFNCPEKGISVNTGIISGGTSVNSIPDSAELRVDIRVTAAEDALVIDKQIDQKINEPFDPRVTVNLKGGITRPPMVPNAKTDIYCEKIEQIGVQVGVPVRWCFSGGGADASFASGMGKPALCGLAAVGGQLHTKDEYLEKAQLEQRYIILKAIISDLP